MSWRGLIISDPLVRNTIDLVSGDQLGEPPRLSLGRMKLPTCTRPNLSYGGVWGSTRLLAPATVNAAGALSRGARWSVPPAPLCPRDTAVRNDRYGRPSHSKALMTHHPGYLAHKYWTDPHVPPVTSTRILAEGRGVYPLGHVQLPVRALAT